MEHLPITDEQDFSWKEYSLLNGVYASLKKTLKNYQIDNNLLKADKADLFCELLNVVDNITYDMYGSKWQIHKSSVLSTFLGNNMRLFGNSEEVESYSCEEIVEFGAKVLALQGTYEEKDAENIKDTLKEFGIGLKNEKDAEKVVSYCQAIVGNNRSSSTTENAPQMDA